MEWLVCLQEKLKLYNETKVAGVLDEILTDVAKAADQLESSLNEHAFDNAVQDIDKQQVAAPLPFYPRVILIMQPESLE